MGTTDLDKQIVTVSCVIGVEKANPDNFVERSILFYRKELYRPALEDANAAIRLDPKCLPAYIAAGKASLKLQRYEECHKYYKDGLALDPKNDEIKEDLKIVQKTIMEDYGKQADQASETPYNAVKLCSQDVYPGDDELLILEFEILAKKYKISQPPTKEKIIPTDLDKRKKAASIGVMAFNCKESKQYQEALLYCTKALEIDKYNYRLRQMKAELYIELENDKLALQELMLIHKPYRIPEVWKLGGIILTKFNLPVMAEFWLRKATNLVPDKDEQAAILFQKVRVDRIYGPLTLQFPVRVEFKDYGRAVVASERLEPGENAFDDIPVVLGQLLNCIHLPACSHCGSSLITAKDYFGNTYDTLPEELKSFAEDNWPDVAGIHCRQCEREMYCSATCRDEAWERYHKVICPALNTASVELYELIANRGFQTKASGTSEELWLGQYSPMVLAKIWGMVVTETERYMKEGGRTEPIVEDWARAKMPFRKFIAFGRSSAVEKMPEIFIMMKNIFANSSSGCLPYNLTEAEFDGRYYQITCNLQAFSASITPRETFMDNISKVEDLRTLKILKYLEKKAPAVSFAGMFPLHACLNHACDNNVEVMDGFVDGKPAVHVRVRRAIEAGDELCTTYIDTAMPRKLRRAWLFNSFNFWCACQRCQFEGDDNTACTNCKKAASDGKKFPGCSRCKCAWYCSTKCQKEAWVKGHKKICQMEHSPVSMQVSEN